MAIGSVDDAIAGCLPPFEWQKALTTLEAANVWHSLAYSAGNPGAMIAPTPGINGAAITSRNGLFPFTNPGGGDQSNLMRFSCHANVAGTMLLCDRLWDNSSIASTTTTLQGITSPAFPARDRNGATSGEGVLLGLEVSTATTNGAAVSNSTITYTNSGGTGSRTATLNASVVQHQIPATAVAGVFVPFLLAAGDIGVQSVQGLTLGTSLGTGVVHLVAYRILARVTIVVAGTEGAVDLVTGGNVRLYDDTSAFLIWIPSATTALGASGQLIVTQG
jgi:hypothetical protein